MMPEVGLEPKRAQSAGPFKHVTLRSAVCAVGASFALASGLFALAAYSWAGEAVPQPSAPAEAAAPAGAQDEAADTIKIKILMAREIREDRLPPLSLLDIPPPDDGLGGARLAISDNNTTGRFLKQDFVLEVLQSANRDEYIAEVVKRVDAGTAFVVADAAPETLIALSDALKDKDAVIFNAAATLVVAGKTDDWGEGAQLAEEALDSGAASRLLQRWIEMAV